MFIKEFSIRNFRNINNLDLCLGKGLNIFIGENNSGKTTVMDALRICLGWGDQEKSIFIKPDDLYINRSDYTIEVSPIEFDMIFQLENEVEQSIFYDLLCGSDGQLELQIHYKFFFEEKNDRKLFRSSIWGGENEGQSIPIEMLDLIRHVYLGALRDASRDLQASKGNKLGSLLEKIESNKIRQQELAKKLEELLHEDKCWKELRELAKAKINEHLNFSSIKGKEINIDLRFIDSDFRRIVGDLRARLPVFFSLKDDDSNQKWFQIIQNGLGDNNRIYIASVLSELLGIQDIEKESYIALLIEEPEAHLHPQLQNVLFSYFEILSNKMQVFITSHSPTITAKTNLDTVIVFQNINNKIHTLSLKNSDLDEEDRSYLHRFLDVTKAQLFFANGVILVEGISESLLFPVFARIMGEKDKDGDKEKYDLTKWGIEIVNVGGVSFSHFAKIFNSKEENKRLNSRCVVVTDSDSIDNKMSERAQNALKLKSGILDVQMSKKTFEHDLFNQDKNSDIIKEVYKDMHPETDIKDADNFLNKLSSNRDKGEFAQKLASKINASNFSVPEYIKKSIEWVTQRNV